MCLAEALLRVPDAETIDALIEDKIGASDWGRPSRPLRLLARQRLHLGADAHRPRSSTTPSSASRAACAAPSRRLGEPVIRAAVRRGHEGAGQPVRPGRDHRRRLRQRQSARRPRASPIPTTCWARPRAPKPTPAPTIDAYCPRDQRHRAGLHRAARSRAIPASPSSSPPCTPATRTRSATASWPSWSPRLASLCHSRQGGRHGPQHRRRGSRPPRPLARRDRGGPRATRTCAAGTASASSSRPTAAASGHVIDWLHATRASASTAASWCASSRAPTGTPRSSGHRSRASPTFRSSPARPRPTSATSPTPASSSA